MNERIADILDQAFDLCRKYDDEGNTGLVKTTEALHLFAELIVLECAEVAATARHGETYGVDERVHWNNGIAEAVDRIIEHFGVES
jgi:hypothetical protein